MQMLLDFLKQSVDRSFYLFS